MFKLDIQGFKGICIKLWSCARCMDFISSSAHLGAICCISSMASSFKRIRIIAIGLFILIIKRIIAFICGNFVQMCVCAVYWNERHPFFFFFFALKVDLYCYSISHTNAVKHRCSRVAPDSMTTVCRDEEIQKKTKCCSKSFLPTWFTSELKVLTSLAWPVVSNFTTLTTQMSWIILLLLNATVWP